MIPQKKKKKKIYKDTDRRNSSSYNIIIISWSVFLSPGRTQVQQFKKQLFKLNSHSRGDLVLEGVGWDPVGAFEENWFPIDAEIKAQSWRADNWLLDKFYCAKIHLQEMFSSNTETLRLQWQNSTDLYEFSFICDHSRQWQAISVKSNGSEHVNSSIGAITGFSAFVRTTSSWKDIHVPKTC